MLVAGLAGPIAGTVFDKLGARAAYCSGLVLLGVSLVLAGSATAVWHYALTVGFASSVGISMLGMVSANALLSRWYRARLGTTIGIAYAASGLAVLIMAPVAQILINSYGWRKSYELMGITLLSISALIAVLPLTQPSRPSRLRPWWKQAFRHWLPPAPSVFAACCP